MKKSWNYLSLFSTLIVILISHIALNEIVYFAIILSLPLIANAVAMYLNFTECDKKRRSVSCLFSTVLQILPLLVLLILSDSKGRLVVLSYIAYVVIISVFLFLFLLVLTHMIRQSSKLMKRIYVLSLITLFAVFLAWFYFVCYLF